MRAFAFSIILTGVVGWISKKPFQMPINHSRDPHTRDADIAKILEHGSGVYMDNKKNAALGLTKSVILVAFIYESHQQSHIGTLLNFHCHLKAQGLKSLVSFIDYETPYDNGPDKQNVSN